MKLVTTERGECLHLSRNGRYTSCGHRVNRVILEEWDGRWGQLRAKPPLIRGYDMMCHNCDRVAQKGAADA